MKGIKIFLEKNENMLVIGIAIFLKMEKKKSNNMVVNNTKIFLKMQERLCEYRRNNMKYGKINKYWENMKIFWIFFKEIFRFFY